MNLRCFFGHIWTAIKVVHYIYGENELPSSIVTFQCQKCGEVRKQEFLEAGYLELSDFIL